MIQRLHAMIFRTEGEKALIITGCSDKFFSVGFDFKQLVHSKDPKVVFALLTGLIKILRRLITFELPTVALINGHCYAGGLMMALSCDWRIMLHESGDVCLSEATMGMNMPVGIRTLLRIKMSPTALRTAVLTGKKFTCKEAFEAKIIDEVVMERSDLMNRGIEFAETLSKLSHNRPNYRRLKYDLYYEIVEEFKKGEKNPVDTYKALSKM